MTSAASVKAHSPAELLAVLPALTGFTAHESVVMVMFRGRFTAGAFRLSLPDPAAPPIALKRYTTMLMGTLCKVPGVTAVVPVILTDADAPADDSPPRPELAATILRRLEHAGFELRDALWQAGNGWGTYVPSRLVGRQSLDELDRARRSIEDRLPTGALDVEDVALPERIPNADAKTLRRVRQQWDRLAPADVLTPGIHPEDAGRLVNTLEDFLTLGPDGIQRDAARFLVGFARPNVRDIALVQWARDLDAGLREALRAQGWRGDVTPDDLAGENTLLGQGRRPDVRRLQSAIEVLGALVPLVPLGEDYFRLGPLTMLGWLNWALGRGTRAGQYIDQARRIDRSYGMAELLDRYFSSGALPDWAFGEPEELARHDALDLHA